MERAYSCGEPGQLRGVRDSVAAFEFVLRFASLLSVAALRSAGVTAPKIARSPGLAGWVTSLSELGSLLDVARAGEAVVRVRVAVQRVRKLYRDGPGGELPFNSYKMLRDHLSHGGPVPDGVAGPVDTLTGRFWDVMADCLEGAEVRSVGGGFERHPVFVWGTDSVDLFPFFYVSEDGSWQIFSAFNHKKPSYISFGDPQRTLVQPKSDEALTALTQLLKNRRSPDDQSDYFRDAILRDLAGFQEASGTPAHPYDEADVGFVIEWHRATSDGTELRMDHFRVGKNGLREWRDDGAGWLPYSAFLRRIANLGVVARRLWHEMDQLEKRLIEEEVEGLGWSSEKTVLPATVTVRDDGNRAEPQRKTFNGLIDDLDEEVGVEHGQTLIYFVNGEAGIGKTRAMLSAALHRAAEVASGDQVDGVPLFLYIRSNGHVLENLVEVVNSAVATTRNLTDLAVKALCRNGVMALLIDGFDELLGGAGFNDAVTALRPWLEELDGRGVLVVSARSSYYANQFQESLKHAQEEGVSVHHKIAEMNRWSDGEVESFMGAHEIPSARLKELSRDDMELLRLPFFARAFAEMARMPGEVSNVAGRLISEYLRREEKKLSYSLDDTTPLLSSEELRCVFEFAAECMVDNSEREISAADLEIGAATVLGLDDVEDLNEARPHLRDRLQVLCGMTAGASRVGSSKRFRFQHELFFDYFLAGLALEYANGSNVRRFYRLLNASEWRPAMVKRVVSESPGMKLQSLLAGFDLKAESLSASRGFASLNLGSLWAAIIRMTKEVPSVTIRDATFIDPLDLAGVLVADSRFVRCTLSGLTLPAGSNWTLTLDRSVLRSLTTAHNPDLSGMRGIIHKSLVELVVPGREVCFRRPEILSTLSLLGASIADEEAASQEPPIAVEAARHFLKNLEVSGKMSMVLPSGYLPEDHRLKWVRDYEDEWKPFVDALVDAHLASRTFVSASGSRKLRVRLRIGPSKILLEDSDDPRVQTFWTTRGNG
ncbi:hypothetical protein ACFUJY_02840 [Streptomyces sp. NPDC057249]|uniref:hypothetical protein n=1 Tax=Streptomyces sp. NPDC057249 TaxID=3346067 RepID=UPI003645E760